MYLIVDRKLIYFVTIYIFLKYTPATQNIIIKKLTQQQSKIGTSRYEGKQLIDIWKDDVNKMVA